MEPLIAVEESERSLEQKIKEAKLGRFKLMADLDWTWPKKIDRELIEERFTLQFMQKAINVVLVGQNGLGKTVNAQALLAGQGARFVTASEMLNDLSAQDGASALRRCLKKYSQVDLLVIDEVGYGMRICSTRWSPGDANSVRRFFKEWTEVFPRFYSLANSRFHTCNNFLSV